MEIKNTIKLSAPISPYDTDDTYPTHFPKFGMGGYRSVEMIEDRDSIPEERRELGMVVYVEATQKVYTLRDGINNDDWIDFNLLFKGLETAKLFVSTEEPKNVLNDYVWLNLQDGCLYYRNTENTYWLPLISNEVDGGDF